MDILEAGIAALQDADPDMAPCLGDRRGDILTLLTTYMGEIELFNPAYKLVGVKNPRELAVKHILDSLAPLGIIRRILHPYPGAAIGDVGSGAGLPGIPLGICLPAHPFTLIERMGRRAGFLRNTLAVLGLSHIAVEETEMERAVPGRFGLITFRAFKPLEPDLLKSLFRLLSPQGILAAYKGRKDKISAEMSGAAAFTGGWEAVPVEAPFLEEERHLVIIEKPPPRD